MKEIKLFGKYGLGKLALVDDKDFERVNRKRWHLSAQGYVRRIEHQVGKSHETRKAKVVFLHQVILGCKRGFVVDHCDLNPLNNQKRNLRHASHSQNHQNRPKQSNNVAKVKGVRQRSKNRWGARVTKDGVEYHLGLFTSKEAAAIAYNKAAKKLFGKFALLNKI